MKREKKRESSEGRVQEEVPERGRKAGSGNRTNVIVSGQSKGDRGGENVKPKSCKARARSSSVKASEAAKHSVGKR